MSSIMKSSAVRRALSVRFCRASTIARSSVSSLEKITTCNPSSPLLHPFRFFSSSVATSTATKPASDIKLARVIESELQCAQEEEDDADQLTLGMPIKLMDPVSQGGLLPDQFPFKIIDIPGEETITLKREFDGESIEVLVGMPQMEGEDEEDDDSDEGDDDDKASGQFQMSLLVTVSKGNGPRLEFSCVASPDEISIDSMLMKGPDESSRQVPYEGPQFPDLDENLQKEFHGYLERRGIKSSLISFLQEYMMKKDSKEYKLWLKSMKEFVEK